MRQMAFKRQVARGPDAATIPAGRMPAAKSLEAPQGCVWTSYENDAEPAADPCQQGHCRGL